MIEGVIFDLGGTLIERGRRSFEPGNATALTEWLRRGDHHVGAEFADAVVAEREASFARRTELREAQAVQALRPVFGRYSVPTDDAFVTAAEVAFYEPELRAMRLLPGTVELLQQLHARQLRIGLASNATSHYFVQECCKRLGISRYLDPIMSSAAVGWAKPDARIFKAILQSWAMTPGHAVMVGDSVGADIAGARTMGMRSILLTAEHDQGEPRTWEGVQADAEAATLKETGRIIERWLQES
ncbi:MAG TPA: HAD family hydrolase [bacterium]|nr:HAD family hydrolase [bacterium]